MNKASIVPYLVKRFLRFDKEQPFIFLSALLAFTGIAIGVMVLIIAMALMNGFDNEFKKKLTVMNYPLTVYPRFYGSVNEGLLLELEQKFPELAMSPYVTSSVIARSGSVLEGGYLFGVDFKHEVEVNAVLKEALQKREVNRFEVVIGKTLKDEFDLYVDDKVTYIFTEMNPGGLAVTPKLKRFTVKAVFDSGLSAYDKAYGYTTMESMQRIMHLPSNQYDGIHIYSENPQELIEKIRAELPVGATIKGWWQDNMNFFA
ncbi:MAG: ABC transporter permease, partial [Thiovulaceae bacterium]|nr:ABC transporter permease [Sulfurimonadaceae bacterium]